MTKIGLLVPQYFGSDRMRYILAIIGLLISVAIAFFCLIVVIATGKEGLAISDLPTFLLIFAVLIFLFLIWFFIQKKTQLPIIKGFSGAGMTVAGFPVLILLFIGGFIIFDDLYGKYLSRQVEIQRYQETLVTWPNFTYPVGIKVEFEVPSASLRHQSRYENPILWMGRDGLVDYSSLYSNTSSPNYAFLTPPILNKFQPAPPITTEGKTSKIVYYLYPGTIVYIENPNTFCKYENGNVQTYGAGAHINGILSWRHHHTVVNLNQPFRSLLLKNSAFENNPVLWDNLHQQFQDENLLSTGFKRCQIGYRKNCFCKSST